MSCMTHTCTKCGWEEFDNNRDGPGFCVNCGNNRWINKFDEEPDRGEEEEE